MNFDGTTDDALGQRVVVFKIVHHVLRVLCVSVSSVFKQTRRLRSCMTSSRKNVVDGDRKSTRLNSSHVRISYAVFCLKKKRRTAPTRRSVSSDCAHNSPRASR